MYAELLVRKRLPWQSSASITTCMKHHHVPEQAAVVSRIGKALSLKENNFKGF